MRPGLPLGISIAGVAAEQADTGPRALVEWAARLGFRFIQLDATLNGLRPRDLDRSARRDLAALLRRLELSLCGLDLWIPPAHFTDPGRADRALAALMQAAELASELSLLGSSGAGTVSVVLPRGAAALRRELEAATASRGVVIADHAWPVEAPGETGSPLSVGIDPAEILLRGEEPPRAVASLGSAPAAARLCDLSSAGRVPPGEGGLDELSYTVALEVKGYRGPLVLDLRGLPSPERTAREVLQRWSGFGVP